MATMRRYYLSAVAAAAGATPLAWAKPGTTKDHRRVAAAKAVPCVPLSSGLFWGLDCKRWGEGLLIIGSVGYTTECFLPTWARRIIKIMCVHNIFRKTATQINIMPVVAKNNAKLR